MSDCSSHKTTELEIYSGPLLAKWVTTPKQNCIVVPPPTNIMEVTKHKNKETGL